MLIRGNKDEIVVKVNIRNSKDNAYNTKVTLSFTPHINYAKVEVRTLLRLQRLSTWIKVSVMRFVLLLMFSAGDVMHSEQHKSGVCCWIPLPGK